MVRLDCGHVLRPGATGPEYTLRPLLHLLFDEIDRKLLLTIIEKYQGGPVGVNTLAASLAEEPDAIEEIYEPFLIQIGFLDRTPRGRVATHLAYEHFKIKRPRTDRSGQETLF